MGNLACGNNVVNLGMLSKVEVLLRKRALRRSSTAGCDSFLVQRFFGDCVPIRGQGGAGN